MDKIYPTPPVHQVSGVAGVKPASNAGVNQVNNDKNNQTALGSSSENQSNRSVQVGKSLPKASGTIVPAEQRQSALEEVFDDKTLKRMGIVECATCASRTYQDGSNDPSVSFQAPTHLSTAQSATAVVSHEMEHVVNEQATAREEGKEVISQSVQIFRDVCPECGISYVSGGVTKTTTAGKRNPYEDALKNNPAGHLVDVML